MKKALSIALLMAMVVMTFVPNAKAVTERETLLVDYAKTLIEKKEEALKQMKQLQDLVKDIDIQLYRIEGGVSELRLIEASKEAVKDTVLDIKDAPTAASQPSAQD